MHQNVVRHDDLDIVYRLSPEVTAWELTELFSASWKECSAPDFRSVLDHSLLFICAYHREWLVGFVRLAWDGCRHAFLLDPTVRPEYRRRGIGRELIRFAELEAGRHGIRWIHLDYEPYLRSFYERCGFRRTEAGLIRVD